MKFPAGTKHLDGEAFAERLVRQLTGRAPDLEVRSLGNLTLRVVGSSSEQTVSLDRAFAQYQEDPSAIDDLLSRWCSTISSWASDGSKFALDEIVPIIKTPRWIEQQRNYHVSQFGDDSNFDICWEPYNEELVLVYAAFKTGLQFLRSRDVDGDGSDRRMVRSLAIDNLRRRTREIRIQGGHDAPYVICADGNLEPSLILLDELWDDLRLRVDGDRLITIAQRGFTISCGSENLMHIWQIAIEAAESYRQAQYPVSPHIFERRGTRFEPLDRGLEDPMHPICKVNYIDVHAIKQGGRSDLRMIIATPLEADARSVYRLFEKMDAYLQFIGTDTYREECGPPSPELTRIWLSIHPATDPAIFALLEGLGDYVAARGATLLVDTAAADQ